MKQLNIIPNPNKIDYLGGSVKMENIDSESFSARLTDKLPEEGYVLEVTENGVEATAGGERGAFYASQTLKQLKQLDICPCVRIEDAPAFEYRAFMLDCARHMTTVENIKKLIDAAALVKMNTMHWHLTDDQGWRVEIDSHPELITVGSRRRSSDFGQYHFAEEYSGYFTKDEIREIVAYADDNYIEVIPEFDMPGHTLSVLAAYPELSCKGKPLEVGTKQGIFDDILCAGNDDSLKLVFDVLGEMIELFPGRYFHIGGDEAPKVRWKNCPKCQARMKELGLKDEEELQGWFVLQAIDFLKKHGKTAIVWNESLNSGMMPNDIIVQRWIDKKRPLRRVREQGRKDDSLRVLLLLLRLPLRHDLAQKDLQPRPVYKGTDRGGQEECLRRRVPDLGGVCPRLRQALIYVLPALLGCRRGGLDEESQYGLQQL